MGSIAHRRPGSAAAFVFGLALLFALYALAYRVCKNWPSVKVACALIVGGVLLAILLVPAYPIGANDVFGYIAGGELLSLYSIDSMVHAPDVVPWLPFIKYVAYKQAPLSYGPLWVWIQAAVIWAVAKVDLQAYVLGFKFVAVAGYATTCALVLLVLKRRAPHRMVAGLVAFAWNPLVLFEVAVNAHNDIWMGALVLAGVLFWEMRRPLLMLAALTLAPLIKLPIAAVLPLFAIAAWRMEPPRGRRRLLIMGALVVVSIAVVSYLVLPDGLWGLASLNSRTESFTHSLPAVLKLLFQLAIPDYAAAAIVNALALLVFVAYWVLQLRNVYQSPSEVVRLAFNTLIFLLLVCMTWFQPWYLLWVVSLAAVYPRPDAPFQAALFTLCTAWTYAVYGFVWFWIVPFSNWGHFLGIELVALVTTYLLPWAYAAIQGWRHRRATWPLARNVQSTQ
jgi:hypothetical protein